MAGLTLPNSEIGRTTQTVGLFAASARSVADWLAAALGDGWDATVIALQPLGTHLQALAKAGPVSTYLLFELSDSWTLLSTDGPLGTDTGVLPSRFATQCGGRAIRATISSGEDDGYPACILEVFDPDAADQQRCLRYVYAANDGGRWSFGQYGAPFAFEQLDAYERRRVRDRFTPEMMRDYLLALGVDMPSLDTRGPAVVVSSGP